ncbi:MAG: RNA polymerase sigma factor [Acidimicrobiales bacterium]
MDQTGQGLGSDRDRFTVVFRRFHPHVTSYVRRRVPPDQAPDIVENAFLAAWRHIRNLPEQPLPWLYRAAAFVIHNWQRSEERATRRALAARSLVRDAVISDTAEAVAWADNWAAAFAELGEANREVLRLVAWENVSAEQAATVLGCSVTAFKVRLHRARRRLVRLVESDEVHSESASAPGGADPIPGPPVVPIRTHRTDPDGPAHIDRLHRKEALP